MGTSSKGTVVNRRHVMQVGDKRVEIEALTLQDWVQAEEEALNAYRRSMISTWTKNADLLPEEIREAKTLEAFDKAQGISLEDLPDQQMEMPTVDPRTGKPIKGRRGRPVTGMQPVPYTAWWMSKTVAGMRYSVYLSRKRADPTFRIEDADEWFQQMKEDHLEELANKVGELSEPQVGN